MDVGLIARASTPLPVNTYRKTLRMLANTVTFPYFLTPYPPTTETLSDGRIYGVARWRDVRALRVTGVELEDTGQEALEDEEDALPPETWHYVVAITNDGSELRVSVSSKYESYINDALSQLAHCFSLSSGTWTNVGVYDGHA